MPRPARRGRVRRRGRGRGRAGRAGVGFDPRCAAVPSGWAGVGPRARAGRQLDAVTPGGPTRRGAAAACRGGARHWHAGGVPAARCGRRQSARRRQSPGDRPGRRSRRRCGPRPAHRCRRGRGRRGRRCRRRARSRWGVRCGRRRQESQRVVVVVAGARVAYAEVEVRGRGRADAGYSHGADALGRSRPARPLGSTSEERWRYEVS